MAPGEDRPARRLHGGCHGSNKLIGMKIFFLRASSHVPWLQRHWTVWVCCINPHQLQRASLSRLAGWWGGLAQRVSGVAHPTYSLRAYLEHRNAKIIGIGRNRLGLHMVNIGLKDT